MDRLDSYTYFFLQFINQTESLLPETAVVYLHNWLLKTA